MAGPTEPSQPCRLAQHCLLLRQVCGFIGNACFCKAQIMSRQALSSVHLHCSVLPMLSMSWLYLSVVFAILLCELGTLLLDHLVSFWFDQHHARARGLTAWYSRCVQAAAAGHVEQQAQLQPAPAHTLAALVQSSNCCCCMQCPNGRVVNKVGVWCIDPTVRSCERILWSLSLVPCSPLSPVLYICLHILPFI